MSYSVPVGSLVVIDSIYNHSAVSPYMMKVISETPKSVEITRVDDNGEVVNIENIKTIRKSSIVAVLESIDDFAPFRKMNIEMNEKYEAYNQLKTFFEKKVKGIKAEFQTKLKG